MYRERPIPHILQGSSRRKKTKANEVSWEKPCLPPLYATAGFHHFIPLSFAPYRLTHFSLSVSTATLPSSSNIFLVKCSVNMLKYGAVLFGGCVKANAIRTARRIPLPAIHYANSKGLGREESVFEKTGAGEWNRTTDLRFTKFQESNLRQPNPTRNHKPGCS